MSGKRFEAYKILTRLVGIMGRQEAGFIATGYFGTDSIPIGGVREEYFHLAKLRRRMRAVELQNPQVHFRTLAVVFLSAGLKRLFYVFVSPIQAVQTVVGLG